MEKETPCPHYSRGLWAGMLFPSRGRPLVNQPSTLHQLLLLLVEDSLAFLFLHRREREKEHEPFIFLSWKGSFIFLFCKGVERETAMRAVRR
jgi:hypothetical protein